MKYVRLRTTIGVDRDIPVIFPDEMVHDIVATAMIDAMKKHGWKNVGVISAGDISFAEAEDITCSGSSETLKKKSRGVYDAKIIYTHDYLHGMVEFGGT